MTETQNDIIYKKFEERITRLEEEKQSLQTKLASLESSSLEDYMDKYDALKAIIQCPINIWKQSDIELKRLLSDYHMFIQKINGDFDISGYQFIFLNQCFLHFLNECLPFTAQYDTINTRNTRGISQ